jgi:hypothetical protein
MGNERIYIVAFRSRGDTEVSKELMVAHSIPELLQDYFTLTDLVEFAFEDVTEASVEEIERRLTYNGKYTM